jgi:hypothetical protein
MTLEGTSALPSSPPQEGEKGESNPRLSSSISWQLISTRFSVLMSKNILLSDALIKD